MQLLDDVIAVQERILAKDDPVRFVSRDNLGEWLMELLLDKRGDEIPITKHIIKVVAENKECGEKLMALLLDQRGDEIRITEELIKAAAGNERSGKAVMALLLGRLKDGKKIQANSEYIWLQDLQTIGYSLEEVADLLLEKARDSPWIYFEPNDFPNYEIQPGQHIPGCSHDCLP